MIPEHIVRDLTMKCADDMQSAFYRSLRLLDDPLVRAALAVQSMQALMVVNAMTLGEALGTVGKPTPTRLEILHGALVVARSVSENGTVRSLANAAQRDVSLLIANGFPITISEAGR